MKVVILAGGLGTRLAEETEVKPKPMVEVGGYPILWHIMKTYSHYGFKEFFVALGYRGEIIKKFFFDYCNLNGNVRIDFSIGQTEIKPTGAIFRSGRFSLTKVENIFSIYANLD